MKNLGVKIYKNKQRAAQESYTRYVPQYQLLGIEPQEYKSSVVPAGTPIIRPQEAASRNRQPFIRQETTLEQEQAILPSFNAQQTWSSVDGEVVDDAFSEGELIDNNDFYTDESLGVPPQANADQSDDLAKIVNDLEVDSYLLMVRGEPICSGPIKEIEDQTTALIFGEHDLCGGEPIPEEDIIVLKKLKINVGVFLG